MSITADGNTLQLHYYRIYCNTDNDKEIYYILQGKKIKIPAVKLFKSALLYVNTRFSVESSENSRFHGDVDKN
jgi:hypothetical protein